MSDLKNIFDVAARGMSAQMVRLMVASNLPMPDLLRLRRKTLTAN